MNKVLSGVKNSDSLHLELASHKSEIIDRKINTMVDQLLNDRFRIIFGVNDDNLLKMAAVYIASGINAVISL